MDYESLKFNLHNQCARNTGLWQKYAYKKPASRPKELRSRRRQKSRSGAALLMCLFVLMFVSVMLINVLDTETIQLSAHRNVVDYERALYLAGAGVHHAAALLEANSSWRGTVSEGLFPANDTYQATAVDGTGNNVVISATGVSGSIVRKLEVTVTFNE